MAEVKFYFDEMLSRAVAQQLVRHHRDVVMAVDANMAGKTDDEHLTYASKEGRVLVTCDRLFAGRMMAQADHAGVICLTSIRQDDVGGILNTLTEFAENHSDETTEGRVFWL